MTSKIKVMVVDDHPTTRLGLRAALEPEDDIELVSDVSSGQAAIRDAEVHTPDVVLMDVQMPGMDGIEACRILKERTPEIRVVMLTSSSDADKVDASIRAGAVGYMLKDASRNTIIDNVRRAARGEYPVDPAVTGGILSGYRDHLDDENQKLLGQLTAREREIVPLVAQGLSNKEIGARLFMSTNTARNHISNVLTKLNLDSRAALAAWSVKAGLSDEGSE